MEKKKFFPRKPLICAVNPFWLVRDEKLVNNCSDQLEFFVRHAQCQAQSSPFKFNHTFEEHFIQASISISLISSCL